MLEVRYCRVSPLAEDSLFQTYYDALKSVQRKQRILSYKQKKDQMRSLAASILLETLLEDHGIMERTLWYNPCQKPFLSDSPWEIGLSHSGDYAAALLSDQPGGVDIEKKRPVDERVIRRFFHPEEAEYIHSSENKDLAFTEIWTKKESFLKMTGTGITVPLEQFSVLRQEENRFFQTLVQDAFVLSTCTGTNQPVRFQEWHLQTAPATQEAAHSESLRHIQ